MITWLVILLFSSANIYADKKPKWVKQRPVDSDYYIGIGMSLKTDGNITYKTAARNNALKELSSEIKVNISSNSMLHQLENNYELQEHFESKTSESVEATLEGYDVFTWENKQEYWIMLKLSKEKYALRQQMKLDYAKKLSSSYYYEGKDAVQKGDIYQGLLLYIQAIKAITPHIQDNLEYKDVDGTINLGTDIFLAINDAFKKINMEPEKPEYDIQFSSETRIPITVNAYHFDQYDQKQPLSNLPLLFTFTQGEGDLNPQSTTNRNGQATCNINRLISKRRTQEITASFDVSQLTESEDEETKLLAKAFFVDEIIPKAIIKINIQKAPAYMNMHEVVFGEKSAANIFSNLVKTELAQGFFDISGSQDYADFTVNLSSDFIAGDERKGNGYSLYIVYANFHISIINNKTHLEIFSDGFSSMKGLQPGSYEHALKDAQQKALFKVKHEILPKLEQLNF